MARAYSGCEVWQQDFLKLDLPDNYFDGVFANAALFPVPSQELPSLLLELAAGFVELSHYYRPAGLRRERRQC